MIRVLLADDHKIVRIGLEQLLANYDDIELLASATDGAEAVAMASELQPDVLLMDMSMPEMDGVEATRQVAMSSPGTRVVVFTSFSDPERILDALDAGAIGYLLKDAEPEELIEGIRAAVRGESPLAPKAASAVIATRTKVGPELSERESEVLVLIATGMTNKQIAARMGIAEKTVKAHLTNIFQRIGVRDRTQAALWAERNGLLGG
jgi:DNA-binding NarL/FixJ family response regulator